MSDRKIVPRRPTREMYEAGRDSVLTSQANDDSPMATAADAYEDMIAAAPSPWQPIETAPKDRRILGWFPRSQVVAVIEWRTNNYEPKENWTLDGGESACLTYDPPTLWMALPEPPND